MIVIIDYKAGNLTSVKLAFEAIGVEALATADLETVAKASKIVFPGVGAAGSAMENLHASGLCQIIRDRIAAGIPFFGICLGTQILFESSEEDGGVKTLGILSGSVKKFHSSEQTCKIPHMGWNQAKKNYDHPLLAGIPDNSDFYFVHSYYPAPSQPADVICTTDYAGITFASMVGRGNVAATQFHIEKSGKIGLRMLQNFSTWDGEAGIGNLDKSVFGSVFTQEDIRIALTDAGMASDEDTVTTFLSDHRRAFRAQEERMCENGNEFLAQTVEAWIQLKVRDGVQMPIA